MVSAEDITTGHFLSSSMYAYFNSVGNGLRISFGGSSLAALCVSSSLNKGRIYFLLLQGGRVASKFQGSCNLSSRSPKLSIKSSYILWSQCFFTKVSIMHTSSGPSSSSRWICFLHKWKMLSSNVMLPNVSCITQFLQLMIAFDVSRNGLPSIIGT